ncbi:MAG: NAD(P)/FAD-dependent oxidoreductase [Candidatus Longimicrobiales bacterium M2_2A_002]
MGRHRRPPDRGPPPHRALPAGARPRSRPETEVDVIVVGAGPGGSITALLLARRGLDVLLLDRAAFPRPKPCGDCMSAAATALLDRLGLLDRVREAGAAEIERWEIVAPGGQTATGAFSDRPALALERRVLDALLLDAAIEAGARFRQAHVVGLHRGPDGRVRGVRTRDEDTLSARLAVGADGLRSVVARELDVYRRAPRLRKVSLTAHVPAPDSAPGTTGPVDRRHGEMHVLDGGVLGIAPSGPDRYNLTLVVGDEHTDRLRQLGPEPFFRSWLERVPSARDRFGRHDIGPLLASGPFDWPTRSPVADGAALVGDAAGYYDPFTGQGIYQAMAAAERLVAAVGPALEAGAGPASLDPALTRYAADKARLTRPARRVQRLVEAVVSRPWLADLALGRLRDAGVAMDRLIEVTGDLRPPRSLLSPAVVSSLVRPPTRSTHDPH